MTVLRTILLGMLGLVLASCAVPLPKAGDYQRQVPTDYLGLMVDTDLLNTSRLDSEDKTTAQELLNSFYSVEYSLEAYTDALQANLDANEHLGKEYQTAEALVGGAAGLSSIGVIFATAAIAVPVTGVIWIAASQYIQHYDIDPQIKKAEQQLAEAQKLIEQFPDVEKIFDGLAFAETYSEVHRRFIKWSAYVKTLEARTAKFFAKARGGQPATGGSPGILPGAPPQTSPAPKD